MSRPLKIRPKTHIPGYIDNVFDYPGGVQFPDIDYTQSLADEKRDQRIFRVKRKHVLKACDRCRVKKTKCDGKQPCNRCSTHNHPCLFRERKATQTKVYSRGFVEMLESHHSLVVKALQELYKYCVNKEGFPGEPLAEAADGHPLTHAILDRLGLIQQAEENVDEPEENTDDLRYLRSLSTTDSNTVTDTSSEPVSPSDPSHSNSNTTSSSPELAHEPHTRDLTKDLDSTHNWEFQQTQPEQRYHNDYPGSNYGVSTHPAPFMPTTSLNPETSCLGIVPSLPSYEQPYLYYADPSCSGLSPKDHFMPGPVAHHQMTTELPIDMHASFDDYQNSFLAQQQYYPFPSTSSTPGGSFWISSSPG